MAATISTYKRTLSSGIWPALICAGLYGYVRLVSLLAHGLATDTLRTTGIIVASVVAVAGFVAVLMRPILGFYLFVVAALMSEVKVETAALTISPPNMMLMSTGLALVLRAPFTRLSRAIRHAFWPVFFILAWLLGATALTIWITPQTDATARFLITRGGYALALVCGMLVVDSINKLRNVLRLLLATAIVASLLATFAAFVPDVLPEQVAFCWNPPLLPLLHTPRCAAYGMSFQPFGSWLAVAFGIAAYSVAEPMLLNIRRRYAVAAAVILAIGLLMAQARGAWMALLLAPPILWFSRWLWKHVRESISPAYVVGGALLAIVVGAGLWFSVLQPVLAMRMDNVNIRLQEYRFAMQLFLDHTMFGVGPLDDRFLALAPLGMPGVDNSFLVELAATGLLGFIPFVALWGKAFRWGVHVVTAPRDQECRSYSRLLLLCLLLELISVQVYVGIGEKGPWFLMGVMGALYAMNQSSPAKDDHSPALAEAELS